MGKNSLLPEKDFVLKIKDYIAMSIEILNKESIFDDQMRQGFLKLEIRKFYLHYSVSKNRKDYFRI